MQHPSTGFRGSGTGMARLYMPPRRRIGDFSSLPPLFAATLVGFVFDLGLGRKGFLCGRGNPWGTRLPDRIRRQSEAPASSSETDQMQRNTRLLLEYRHRLQEALAGRFFSRRRAFRTGSYECRSVHLSNQNPQTRRRGDTGACRGDVKFGKIVLVSLADTVM